MLLLLYGIFHPSYRVGPLKGGDLAEHLYRENTKLDYLFSIQRDNEINRKLVLFSKVGNKCLLAFLISIIARRGIFSDFFEFRYKTKMPVISQKKISQIKISNLLEKFHFKFEMTFLSEN